MTTNLRPAVFVGSSSEGLAVAKSLQLLLTDSCDVELWNQGTFGLGVSYLESLRRALPRFDFAILVVQADDVRIARGQETLVARDNLVFEAGLFMGALGPERTFLVYDRTHPPSLPTDLAGIECATYVPHASGNLDAALGATATRVERAAHQLGLRADRQAANLAAVSKSVVDAGGLLEQLTRVLARSRKVELDIIATQFAPFIDQNRVQEMNRDLVELTRLLGASESTTTHSVATNSARRDPER